VKKGEFSLKRCKQISTIKIVFAHRMRAICDVQVIPLLILPKHNRNLAVSINGGSIFSINAFLKKFNLSP